jgi:dihydrofolate synthase/folylpolyglutamate synthase
MSALEQLHAREFFGIKLGLDNMRALTAALGHPDRAYSSVIIAGTNGKGSVTAMVDRALRAAGYRVGRYTSPHLVRIEERFAIDGEPIATAALEAVTADVLAIDAAAQADGRLAGPATFFELTTAIALELFRRHGVAVAVLEVGLGGRFDATNIVMPRAAAITSIAFDHMKHLGDTLSAIAFEKAGVIKPGIPVVAGDLPPDAETVITRVATEQRATLVHAHEGVECKGEVTAGAAHLTIETPTRTYGPLTLALPGRHQIGNAVVAVRLLEELDALGLHTSAGDVTTGLADVHWRGRLERVRVRGGREVLLDAAHNPAGAAALASYLREVWPGGVPIVFGVMADKDMDRMLAELAPVASEIIVTSVAMPRAASLEAIVTAAERYLPPGRVRAIADPSRAVDAALAATTAESPGAPAICVAGSIFLLGALLPYVETLRE